MSNVYAITHPDGYIKIGKSNHPISRFNEIRMWSPKRLKLFAILSTDGDALELEGEIHKELSDDRRHGEWFDVTETEVFDIFQRRAETDDEVYSVEEVNYERGNELRDDNPPDTDFSPASEY